MRRSCGRLPSPQNLLSGVKDALGGAFTDRLTLGPRLDVSPAEFSAGQSERFTAKKGHGLGFDLSHTAGRLVGVGKVGLLAVQEAMGLCVSTHKPIYVVTGLMSWRDGNGAGRRKTGVVKTT